MIVSEVQEGEFPTGIVCMECKRELEVGDLYTSRPSSLWDGSPDEDQLDELICLLCADTKIV